MKLKDYLETDYGKTIEAVCYYGMNGRYYYHPISKAKNTIAMNLFVDQIVDGKDGKLTAWLSHLAY